MAPKEQDRDRHESLSSNNSAAGLLARRGKPYQQHRRLQSGGSSVPSTVSPVLSSPPWRQPQAQAQPHPRTRNQAPTDQEPYYEESSTWEKRAPGGAGGAAGGIGAGTMTTTISSPMSPRRPPLAAGAGTGEDAGAAAAAAAVGRGGGGGGGGGGDQSSSSFEFRGFDFFAKKDFNDLRDASRAYFNNLNVGRPSSFISFGGASSSAKRSNSKGGNGNAGAAAEGNGASWLGDATPPASPTLGPKRMAGAVPPLSGGDGGSLDGDEKAKGRGTKKAAAVGVGAGASAGVGAAAAAGGDGGEGGGLAGGGGDGMFPDDEPEPRILGLRKRMFWVLMALLGAILLVIIIAVSVGVSMGKKNDGGNTDNFSAVEPTATSVMTDANGATTVTETKTTPPSTVTTTATKNEDGSATPSPKPMPGGSARVDCPAANGTTCQVPGSDKKFLRICGVDYSSKEATDIGQVQTETMLDCMKNCAGTSACDACAWGYIDGDQGTLHRCWMKSNLAQGGGHEVDEGWSFARLI